MILTIKFGDVMIYLVIHENKDPFNNSLRK